jgi:hypothetical protein
VGTGVEVAATIVNRTHPEFGAGTDLEARKAADLAAAGGDDGLAALWTNVAELRSIRARELAVVAPLVEVTGVDRLTTLPLLDRDVHDLAGLWVIADHLFGAAGDGE